MPTSNKSVDYEYENSWKDQLSKYNGKELYYDATGNLTEFDGWTYTWEGGRQLKKMEKTGMTVEFKYNHNGLRTQKIVTEGTTKTITEYTLHGKLITHLTKRVVDEEGNETIQELHFFYDANDCPAMMSYNGTMYRYICNMQGDIISLVDNAGTSVVEYHYDNWGNLTSASSNLNNALGMLNPFRFKGYVWDEEIGLYYLRSRLYNPKIGRFINADGIIINSILGKNIFCYCWNNSTNYIDSSGMFALSAILIKIGIGAIASLASSVASDLIATGKVDVKGVVKDTVVGAFTNLIPDWLQSAASFVVNTADYLWTCYTSGDDVEASVIVWEATSALASGVLGAGFEEGAKATNKVVDDVVEEIYGIGIDTATSAVSKDLRIKAEEENAQKKKNQSVPKQTDPNVSMPYLKVVYDPLIGKMREVICY